MSRIKKGFTLIELTLAMIFISLLLISIGMITIHITDVYQKGLSMRAVNSVGKQLVDDFSRAINNAPIRSLKSFCGKYDSTSSAYKECIDDNARKFIYQETYGDVVINGTSQKVPLYGVFCTGRYSYIWNTGYALNAPVIDDNPSDGSIDMTFVSDYGVGKRAILKDTSGNIVSSDFRLMKVADFSRYICTSHVNATSYTYNSSNEYVSSQHDKTDLLDDSEDDLVLYNLTVFKPTEHTVTNHAFYSGTFILATLNGTVDITGTGDYCTEPPDNLATDFNYCAINKFNFGMQSAGELTKNKN